jgi:hypothetical protein
MAWFLVVVTIVLAVRLAQIGLRYLALRTTGREVRWEWPIPRLVRQVRARRAGDR